MAFNCLTWSKHAWSMMCQETGLVLQSLWRASGMETCMMCWEGRGDKRAGNLTVLCWPHLWNRQSLFPYCLSHPTHTHRPCPPSALAHIHTNIQSVPFFGLSHPIGTHWFSEARIGGTHTDVSCWATPRHNERGHHKGEAYDQAIKIYKLY